MKILEVSERSSVEIPVSDLLHAGGKLKIRSDLIGRGLVEIRQADHTLKLRVNGIVGRLPVTDDLALDIKPKFSVSNLNRVVYASRTELQNPFFLHRPYARLTGTDYLPVPLVRSFSRSILSLTNQGIFRSYIRQEQQSTPRPKINFMKSEQKYWSRLQQTKAHIEVFDYSHDNLPNQCLKLAAIKALKISKTASQLTECVPVLAEVLRQFVRVSQRPANQLLAAIPTAQGMVPSIRDDYAFALNLALEILRHTDFSLDTTSDGVQLESYIISLDDAFEKYIRNTIRDSKPASGINFVVLDGNIQRHQRPLFSDNKKYPVKPDLIMRVGKNITMIGDVKYKMKPEEVDRYQIISHALSFGVSQAVLVYPRHSTHAQHGLTRLGRVGVNGSNIVIFEYYYDLAGNLVEEEERLQNAVLTLALQ